MPISARDGSGMEDLLSELKGLCMPGGHLFPEDTLTDQPERVIAGELVREKTLRLLDKEVPHGVAAVTERMKDRDGILDIDVTLYCEKARPQGHSDTARRRYAEKNRHGRPGRTWSGSLAAR